MDAAAFKELFRKMPNFAWAMFREASVHLADFGFRFYEASALRSKERLQAELLRLAREAKWHGQVAVIDPAPTHQELAELVGCAREVVTRGLKQLAQEGVIRTDKRVLEITDVAELLARDTKATGRVMSRLEADGPEFRSGVRGES